MRPSPHPHKGFVLHPHINVLFKGAPLKSNSLGYPDDDFQKEKGPNKYRILGLGDSVMMGWAVEKNYLSLLEGKKCGNKVIETFNMGIAGQSAMEEAYLYHDALEYLPDLILIGYVGNDWISEATPREMPSFSSPSFALNALITSLLDKNSQWHPLKSYPFDKPDTLPRAYALMSQMGKHTPTLVVMDSRYESEENSHAASEGLFKTFGMKTLNLLEEWHPKAKGLNGFKAVTIENEHNKKYIIPKDFHPNQTWHQDAAARIYQTLLEDFCE